MGHLSREQFPKHLRSALNRLYDPNYLRRSPLVAFAGLEGRFDPGAALQRVLIEAIEALEPGDGEPSASPAWSVYEVLYYRYVRQLSRQQVADQLGVCVRHANRKQRIAIEALASTLGEQFNLDTRPGEDRAQVAEEPRAGDQAVEAPSTVSEELAWLREALPGKPTDLKQTLRAVLDQVRPLATRYGVSLETTLPDVLPALDMHQLALKQALLNLIGVAMHQAKGGEVCIAAKLLKQQVEIEIAGATSPPPKQAVSDEDQAAVDLAHQLAELSGARLTCSIGDEAFVARLAIPAFRQWPVLAIDDNAHALRLLQRYTADTRYHLVGTRDPEQAVSLAEKLHPRMVVLDVMMPGVDGWELLALLRQHPVTSHIPIVVCTILTQEDLAFSLGASGFVRKPVTRQAFLAALDRQIELDQQGQLMESGSR